MTKTNYKNYLLTIEKAKEIYDKIKSEDYHWYHADPKTNCFVNTYGGADTATERVFNFVEAILDYVEEAKSIGYIGVAKANYVINKVKLYYEKFIHDCDKIEEDYYAEVEANLDEQKEEQKEALELLSEYDYTKDMIESMYDRSYKAWQDLRHIWYDNCDNVDLTKLEKDLHDKYEFWDSLRSAIYIAYCNEDELREIAESNLDYCYEKEDYFNAWDATNWIADEFYDCLDFVGYWR